jgi:ATP phosphoribosyltransferase regulatory subunit
MKNDSAHWILPQGIEETLPGQAAKLECLRRSLLDLYAAWGYRLVIPPFIDHIESLLTGTGHDLDLQTMKLVDQVSGRTLGIRADMTPQVARIDARQQQGDVPNRLCYIGTVLRARPDCFGSSRSPLQVGAELYGHKGVASDVEILNLLLKTFEAAGVDDVCLDLGNVGIFRSLAEQAGLLPDDESTLLDMLQRKAVTEIGELLASLNIDQACGKMIAGLAELNGGLNVFDEARATLAQGGGEVLAAIAYLEQVTQRISHLNNGIKLNVDLAELHGYHYHTGVVFGAFTPRLGQEIARGGRYDNIGAIFGRGRAATGFSTDLKLLISLSNCEISAPALVLAPDVDDEALRAKIDSLRAEGYSVISALPGQNGQAADMGCSQQLELINGQWQLASVES